MMNRDRRLSPRNLTIKALFRDLVDMAGGVTRAATLTCVNASRVSNYCSPNDSAMPPADVILDLEHDVGEPIVTRALADLAGFSIVPKCSSARSADFMQHLGDVAKECGEAVAAIGKALPGGIDAQEAHDCVVEIDEAIETLTCAREDLKRVVAGAVTPLRRRSA
jgi:hypothetical protein